MERSSAARQNDGAKWREFLMICSWYVLNSGFMAFLKATAFAAMMCMSGPPWMPGKIIESIILACSLSQRIRPPLGPRSVLCVVPVTKWATPTGVGWSPVATAPAMWAMSAKR